MKKIVYLVMPMLLIFLASAAYAATVSSQFILNEINLISDNSAEYLLNKIVNGSTTYATDNGDTLIQLGDRLRGGFNVGTVEFGATTNNLGVSGVNELTGIFDITVTSVIDSGVNGPNRFQYTFGPTASFESTFGSGAMMALFEDTTPDYQRNFGGTVVGPDDAPGSVKEEGLLNFADNGNLWMVLGYTGAGGTNLASENWVASSFTNDTALVGAVPLPSNGGTVNLALDIITNNSGLNWGHVPSLFGGFVALNGSANLIGLSGESTPFDVYDNFDGAMKPIPEPGTLSLMGAGILGLVFFARRRK